MLDDMHSLTFGFLLRKQSLPSDVRYMQLEIDEEVHVVLICRKLSLLVEGCEDMIHTTYLQL